MLKDLFFVRHGMQEEAVQGLHACDLCQLQLQFEHCCLNKLAFSIFVTGAGGQKYVTYEDRAWHNDCFKCTKCKTTLVGKGFHTEGLRILCPKCAQMQQIKADLSWRRSAFSRFETKNVEELNEALQMYKGTSKKRGNVSHVSVTVEQWLCQ